MITEAREAQLSLYSELNANVRTLILPCSEKKLSKADIAFNLYQGTGYLSIVKKWPKSKLDEAFNIYFIVRPY